MVYLCLDLGLRHTGVAISHEGELAEPLVVIHSKDVFSLLSQLQSYLDEYQPDLLVIGAPTKGPISTLAPQIAETLSPRCKTIIVNEDNSSIYASRSLKQSGQSPIAVKNKDHQTAAAFILQDYLDNQKEI